MVDSFIANARVEECVICTPLTPICTDFWRPPCSLRATVRILLASMPPSTAQAFTKAARSRLASPNASPPPHPQILFLFDDPDPIPPSDLYDLLAHARALYGA